MMKRVLSDYHAVLWLLFLLSFAIRAYGLSHQPPTADEVGAASAASNYMYTGLLGQVMWYHPPLRNIIIFFSGKLFGGYTAWGLRFGSILFGSLTVPVLGYLANSLFERRAISYLAAFFLCLDPLHISLSREAFQETTTPFLIMTGVLAAYHGIRKDSIGYCYLSGALFGLAAASKWHGLFPWAACAMAYLAAPWLTQGHEGGRIVPARILGLLAAYVAIPVTVYIAVYIPWLYRGYSLPEFVDFQLSLLTQQYLHKGPAYAETILSHRAYQWFLWPVGWADFVFHQGKPYLNIAMGNFLVWGLTLPSLYLAIRRWLRERSFGLGFAVVLFLVSYLPLVLTTSRGVWVFSAPAIIPFAFILSAYAIMRMVDEGKVSRKALYAYLGSVIVITALMYPMSTFKTLEYPYLRPISEIYSPHR